MLKEDKEQLGQALASMVEQLLFNDIKRIDREIVSSVGPLTIEVVAYRVTSNTIRFDIKPR